VDYRMIEKPRFTIAATVRQFTTVNEENFVKIPAWWEQFLASPECDLLTGLASHKPGPITGGEMLGICIGEGVEFSYGIGVELPQGASPGKFQKIEIRPATWAVFDCTVSNIQDVTKRIFSEWFPSTSFEHDDVPELEVYLPGGKGDVMPVEIWIPVKKKG
jgi:AraC family transcriptional regulator